MVIITAALLFINVIQLIRLFITMRIGMKSKELILKRSSELAYLSVLLSQVNKDNQTMDEYFSLCLNQLREKVGWTYHSIFRLDEQKQLLSIRFTGGLPKWYMEELGTKFFTKVGDLASGRAVATNQPVMINDADDDPRYVNGRGWLKDAGYHAVAAIPMRSPLKTYGAFCTYSRHRNVFTMHDIQFFTTCANFYTAIMENKLLSSSAAS